MISNKRGVLVCASLLLEKVKSVFCLGEITLFVPVGGPPGVAISC